MQMIISKTGLELIKSFEGCSLKAYLLKGENYYTIGYGHSFDSSINANTVWTQEKATEMLDKDLDKYEGYVNTYALKKFPHLNQNQFDSLVSYCYNRGVGGLKQLVNASANLLQMATNIVVYWGSAVAYKKGLIRRRKAEQALFNTAVEVKTRTNVETDEALATAVSKIIKSGIQIDFNSWKRKDLIKLLNVNYLLCKLGGIKYTGKPTDQQIDQAIDHLVEWKVISERDKWDPDTARYSIGNTRSLLIKYAAIKVA